jgi:tRNA 2-thiouridine synthesizing protein A
LDGVSMPETKPDKTIDCFGLICPMPIVETAKEMTRMKKGQILEIIADDEGIVSDIPAWCESTGNKFLGMEKKGEIYHMFVKKLK